jgi:hypothetical protein
MNCEIKNDIDLIDDVYEYNIKLFFDTQLKEENLLESFPVASEMFDMITKKKCQSIEDHFEINKISDRILSLCLGKLFNDTNKEEILLFYLRKFMPHCSSDFNRVLLKVFLFYYEKVTIDCSDHDTSTNPTTIIDINIEIKKNIERFSDKDIKFMDNFFSLIIKTKQCSNSADILLKIIENSFSILHGSTNDQSIVKLCVNVLSKLANLNEKIKEIILDKLFCKINENNNSKTGYYCDSIDNKRLESYFQDHNIHLLVNLADHLINSETIYYLNKPEIWYTIQSALIHTNPLSRKRALYFLKRTKDTIKSKNSIKCYTDSSNNQILFQSDCRHWNDYFLCIEMLEETSVSLSLPFLFFFQSYLSHIL